MKTEMWALVISGLSFGVSLLSALFNLSKDSKKLQFIIYRAELYSRMPNGSLSKDQHGATRIELVNNGFRLLCVSHIGGDLLRG